MEVLGKYGRKMESKVKVQKGKKAEFIQGLLHLDTLAQRI